ncbi:3034_t:CDS:2, partial [Dentiscutata heterogama]
NSDELIELSYGKSYTWIIKTIPNEFYNNYNDITVKAIIGEESTSEPSNTDDANNPWNLVSTYKFISSNGAVGESSLIEAPDDNTNLFTMFSTSILAVYFMLTGDSSAVSPWGLVNNWTLTFLLVIFSFFTTIYLLNLFISLLGNAINQTYNEESFLQLRGEILAEIELFWMLPHQRRKKNWFPEILYYEVPVQELKKYIKNLNDEQEDEILQDLLPGIKKIAGIKEDEDKDSTKDSIEDWPYSLITKE